MVSRLETANRKKCFQIAQSDVTPDEEKHIGGGTPEIANLSLCMNIKLHDLTVKQAMSKALLRKIK